MPLEHPDISAKAWGDFGPEGIAPRRFDPWLQTQRDISQLAIYRSLRSDFSTLDEKKLTNYKTS